MSAPVQHLRDRCQSVHVVYDMRTGEVVGVAIKTPGVWEWEFVRLEGEVGRVFRQVAVGLFADTFAKVVGVAPDPATAVDEVVSVVAPILDRRTIMLRLCNAAVQAVVCHLQLASFAPALGKMAEDILAALLPEDRFGKMVAGLSSLAVAVDIGSNQLTATVQDYAAGKLADVARAETAGITPSELDAMSVESEPPRLVVSSWDLEDLENVPEPGGLPRIEDLGEPVVRRSLVDGPTHDDGPGRIG